MIVAGIETSCDDTSVGIMHSEKGLLCNNRFSQTTHSRFGGIVPEIASREHIQKINPVFKKALSEAEISVKDLDLVCATNRPGLIGALLVGMSFAKGLCCGLRIPFMAVNHLEAHLFANFFENRDIVYPIAGLIVSGGNTRIVRIDENREFTLLSDTVDDAAGEAFDKCGKLLGLSYPAGPEISELAKEGDKNYFHFPRAMPRSDNFSFSGLKTAVLNHVGSLKPSEIENRRPDICASFQEAVADVIVKKTARIVLREKTPTLFFSGGVAANRRIRTRLEKWCLKNSVRFCVPEPELCTDNGAMVAMAGYIRYKEGKRCSLKEKTYAVDSLILK